MHTPGPWRIAGDGERISQDVVADTADGLAVVATGPWWLDEGKANRHLITAAPDLLQSLTTIVSGLREGWWGEGSGELEEGELELAEAAIDKARGEQVPS